MTDEDREDSQWVKDQLMVTAQSLAEFCSENRDLLTQIETFVHERLCASDFKSVNHLHKVVTMLLSSYLSQIQRTAQQSKFNN